MLLRFERNKIHKATDYSSQTNNQSTQFEKFQESYEKILIVELDLWKLMLSLLERGKYIRLLTIEAKQTISQHNLKNFKNRIKKILIVELDLWKLMLSLLEREKNTSGYWLFKPNKRHTTQFEKF